MELLKIKNRKMVTQKNQPFFWLADTAWELFHKLSKEEASEYLENRARLKFSVIQAVLLAELNGLDGENPYGRKPLLKDENEIYDPMQPDIECGEGREYTYWDHVDYMIGRANELGLYMAILPTWGDKIFQCWGQGPEIFNEKNAYEYGKWIGRRFGHWKNVIWVLGGDRKIIDCKHVHVIEEMVRGIKETETEQHLMTLHPSGCCSSSDFFKNASWIDFHMIQSGHDILHQKNYEKVASDYKEYPLKAVLDGEPRYEDHPIGFQPANGYFDDWDVRQAAYWSVFSGACGHTYGHHSIWSMNTEKADYFIMSWKEALNRPGALQMQYVRALVESHNFNELKPCQNMLSKNYEGANHLQAAKGLDYIYVYTPNGLSIELDGNTLLGKRAKVSWYNPRNGKSIQDKTIEIKDNIKFYAPSSGRKEDWILILDILCD